MPPENKGISVMEVLNMNRAQRRRIAKLNHTKMLPSILNVKVIDQTAEEATTEQPNESKV